MTGKRWLWIPTVFLLAVVVGIGFCYKHQIYKKESYAIVMKSKNNWYNELAGRGYRQVIEAAGKSCLTLYPDNASTQEQIRMIRSLIHGKVDGIAVAANDEYALSPVLKEARSKGIPVITLDADTEPGSRSIYIKPVDARKLGRRLVQSVYDVSRGKGQWAILSAGSRSANQNEWIDWMKQELEDPRYQDMRLVDIAYGEGIYESASKEVERLLHTYPGIKVICSISTEGIRAAADVVKAMGKEGDVKVTGVGLPEQMANYMGSAEEDICPVMYIWNPINMGELAAYISLGLSQGDSMRFDQPEVKMPNGRSYKVITGRDGGLEIISGEPIQVDGANIAYWNTRFK